MTNWKERNRQIIEEFRSNEGKVGGWFANRTLLLLHTTGAKSGKQRINPLMTFEDAGRLVIVASKGGARTHPDWYHNIVADPDVVVEYGPEKFEARAVVAEEPERSELYEKMIARASAFAEYRERAERTIPVVTLERKA